MMDSGTVIVMNHGHENDVTGLIEEGGKSSFLLAGDIAESIRKHIPDFKVEYEPDHRQAIADTWPMGVDDSAAREEWGWEPEWDLDSMTADMLERLRAKLL